MTAMWVFPPQTIVVVLSAPRPETSGWLADSGERLVRGCSVPLLFVSQEHTMNVERSLRLIAGVFVMLSVWLGMTVDARFLWFTLFVSANLFQSAFTNWCPMMTVLRRAGVRG